MSYKYKNLFLQDSVKKELYIAYDNGTITNEELHSNQFELTESICSESELRFGGCEASVLKFKISNIFESLKNKQLDVSMVLNGNSDTPFIFGKYKVFSDIPTADRAFREIVAYDKMYDIINANVAEWYNSLTFPMTLKEFRSSFVALFKIEEVSITLVNDSMTVEKTIEPSSLSGRDVAHAICEINGCFGHINRDDKFEYIVLPQLSSAIYPSESLYPSDSVYPSVGAGVNEVLKTHYLTCQYEDFKTRWIDGLEIKLEENETGILYGDNSNVYVVNDNFLVYGKSEDELTTIAQNLLNLIRFIQYRPMSVSAVGNPVLSVGSGIRLSTKYDVINSYILKRTLSGIQGLRDSYSSEGVEYYGEKVNSTKTEIKNLKAKTNTLTRTVNETKSQIEEVDKELRSTITQTAEKLEVSIEDAKKVATSYLSYDSENGLQIGNKTTDGWAGFRSRIKSDAFEILDQLGNVLSSYGAKLVELGKNSANAVISFCSGKGNIEYGLNDALSISESLNLKSEKVVVNGETEASLRVAKPQVDENGELVGGYIYEVAAYDGGVDMFATGENVTSRFSLFGDDALLFTNMFVDASREYMHQGNVYGTVMGMGYLPDIPEGEDVNDYLTPGAYRIATTAIAKTITNLPIQQAGRFKVETALGAPMEDIEISAYSYILQTYYTGGGVKYTRYVYTTGTANTWTYEDWHKHMVDYDFADHVVAQGTSGIWTYRKWASGIAECWGRTFQTVTTATTANSKHYTDTYSVALPFTFAGCTSIQLTSGDPWMTVEHGNMVDGTSITWKYESHFAFTGRSYSVGCMIYVMGRWK